MKLSELSLPERIVVERLAKNEPLGVVNSWLEFNSLNKIGQEGYDRLKIKYNEVINSLRNSSDTEGVFKELLDIKDRLVDFSKHVEDPKDLAQISNSLNAVSKTIDDFLERSKGNKDEEFLKPEELIDTLMFLEAEGYFKFGEGKLNELRVKLFEEV